MDKFIFFMMVVVVAALAAIAVAPNYILVEIDKRGDVVGNAVVFPISKKMCEAYVDELKAFGTTNKIHCVLIKTHRRPESN